MNNRANIMYFIGHLCDMAQRENHHNFVKMMQNDIYRVVDAVAPDDGSGAANVKVARKVHIPKIEVYCWLQHLRSCPGLEQSSTEECACP